MRRGAFDWRNDRATQQALRSNDNRNDKVLARNRLRIIIRNRSSKVAAALLAREWMCIENEGEREADLVEGRVTQTRNIVPNTATLENRNCAV